jgi:hypothetical protein
MMKRAAFYLLAIVPIILLLTNSCSYLPALINQPTKTKFVVKLLPTLTPSLVPTLMPTPNIITATIPAIFISTDTPTPIPSTVSITIEDTKKGHYLNIARSTDQLVYKLGPLAEGTYKVGPTDDFLIYCTNDGAVYASKLGDPFLQLIGSVKYFTAILRNSIPKYEIDIFFNNGAYKVNIRERLFGQNEIIVIPRTIAN